MAATGLKGWRGLLVAAFLCFVAGAVGVAQFDLRRHPSFAAVEADLREAIGLQMSMGPVHLDLIAARGAVIQDLEISLGSFRLRVPRAVVRPAWRSWQAGEFMPAIYAERFEVWVDAEDSAEAVLCLKELLELAHFPEAELKLHDGSVRIRDGSSVMHGVSFTLDGIREEPSLSARARTSRGGRVDVRGERKRDGVLYVHAYPEELPVADAPSWLASAGMSLPADWEWPEIPLAVTGRWHVALAPDDSVDHDFDLNLDGQVVPVALEVRGELRAENQQWSSGSRVSIQGNLGRLRSEHPGRSAMMVSGPLDFELFPTGPVEAPRIRGSLNLQDAHLWIASRLKKVCGVAANLRFDSFVAEEQRVSTLGLELGSLQIRGTHVAGGPLLASSNWVPTPELASLFPALSERARGGDARMASLRIEDLDRVMAEVQLRNISLGGRRMPVDIVGIDGVALVGSTGIEAHDLRVTVSGIPLRTSFQARFDDPQGDRRLNIDVRAGEIDLAALGLSESAMTGGTDGTEPFPRSESAAAPSGILRLAEGPVGLLRRQRVHLDDWIVDRARVRIDTLRGNGEVYRNLDFVMVLRALRLELAHARFSQGRKRFGYAGSIDLNPLVPEVKIAAAP